MVAILNSAMFKSTILDSGILVFPLKITHTCQDWMPPFAQKKLHSFILTQLDDGSHLEFGHLGFIHLSISSQTHSHLQRLVPTICRKELHSFILIQLDEGGHLEFCHFAETKTSPIHSHSTCWWQSSWILPSWIQPFCTKKNFIHSLSLNLMMAAILNSAMLDSDSAIFNSDTLLSSLRFTQKHPHSILTLTQTNSIWQKTHSFSLNFMMAAILNSAMFKSTILDSGILVFPLKITHTCQDWMPLFAEKNFTHSFWLNLMKAAILNSAILQKKTSPIHSHSTWWW